MGQVIRCEGRTLDDILAENLIGGPTPWGIHRWRDFHRCPKRYHYKYRRRLIAEGAKGDALAFGSIIHEMLARHYRREKPLEVIHLLEQRGWGDNAIVEDARRVYAAYCEKYPKKEDPYYRGVKYRSWIERLVQPDPRLTSRIDVAYLSKGGLAVVDHKSSSAMTASLTKGFEFDPQMLTLVWGAMTDKKLRRYVKRSLMVEINVLVRTKEPQFTRVRHRYSRRHLERFQEAFTNWQDSLDYFKKIGDWPRTYACVDMYRRQCEYMDACHNDNEMGLSEAPEGRVL